MSELLSKLNIASKITSVLAGSQSSPMIRAVQFDFNLTGVCCGIKKVSA